MILKFVPLHQIKETEEYMNYKELERKLKKEGCYDTKRQMNGHPIWYSPQTGAYFKTSNHKNQEVATGTLNSILKAAGIK